MKEDYCNKKRDAKQKMRMKPSIMKMLLVFMMLCIVCSFVLNILLYRRICSLKKKIDVITADSIITGQEYIRR